MRGDADHALAVADHDVAGIDRHAAAADRHVQIDRVVVDQVRRGRWPQMVDGPVHPRDLRRVAEAAVADRARAAPAHQPGQQDAAGRRRARIAAAIDDEHGARGTFLDALALRMAAILEHLQHVQVLARRDVAQRVGRTDQARRGLVDQLRSLQKLVAQTALEQDRGDGGGRNLGKLVAGGDGRHVAKVPFRVRPDAARLSHRRPGAAGIRLVDCAACR